MKTAFPGVIRVLWGKTSNATLGGKTMRLIISKKAAAYMLFVVFASAFVVMSVSCSSEGYVESRYSADLVDVSLEVDAGRSSKSIVYGYPAGTKEIFQYRASWQGDGRGVQGETKEWTEFRNGRSIGSFSRGTWIFDVRIILGNTTTYGVIYSGSETVSLSEGTSVVKVGLSSTVPESGEGYVSFDIGVSDEFSSKGTIKVFVDGDEVSGLNVYRSSSMSGSVYNGAFKCAAGYKNMRFEYWDLGADAAACVSSQVLSVRVVENTTVSVEGTLLPGHFAGAELKVEYKSLSAVVSGRTPVEQNSSLNYICTVTGGGEAEYHYQWYLNGLPLYEHDYSIYPMTWYNTGHYSLTCVVWCLDEGQRIYTSGTLDVEVI